VETEAEAEETTTETLAAEDGDPEVVVEAETGADQSGRETITVETTVEVEVAPMESTGGAPKLTGYPPNAPGDLSQPRPRGALCLDCIENLPC